jgi:hypothetical protein
MVTQTDNDAVTREDYRGVGETDSLLLSVEELSEIMNTEPPRRGQASPYKPILSNAARRQTRDEFMERVEQYTEKFITNRQVKAACLRVGLCACVYVLL